MENDKYTQNNFDQEEAYLRAKKKLDKLKGFYWHLAWYIIVNVFLIITIARNLDADETIWQFGVFATPFFWGIGLFFHFVGAFGASLFFSKKWEKRKIEEYMNKDKRNWE
jgi:2TM domain-containing protein